MEDRGGTGRSSVIHVCGPAGYGKSTLVRQWVAHRGESASWVSLDAVDGDVLGFWAAVAEALGHPWPRDPVDVREDVLIPLVAGIGRHGERVTLVLDDVHRVDDARTLDSLSWFLARIPEPLTVVMSSRTSTELPALANLRARGEVLDVDAESLRFTDAETRSLLVDVHGLSLDDDALERVAATCEGWPAAVALVALGLRRGDPLDRLLSGPRRAQDPFTTLVRAAVSSCDPHEHEVLLALSVLGRFTEAVVASVLDDPHAWPVVRRLDDVAGLAIPLDDGRVWWRLHRLVRDVLHDELGGRDPARRRQLHARAAAVFEARGDLSVALDHLHAAGSFDDAARLIGGPYGAMAVPRSETGLAWFRRIPDAVRDRDPVLCLVGGWLWAMSGDRAERDRALAAGRRCAPDGAVADCVSWESAESAVRAASCFGDVGSALAAARRVVQLEPEHSPTAIMMQWRTGALLYLAGDAPGAEAALRAIPASATAAAAEHDGPLLTLAPAYLSLALFGQGRVDEAATQALRAADARRVSGFRHELPSLVVFEAVARAQTESGDPARGLETALEGVRRAAAGYDGTFIVPRLLGEVARAHDALGDPAEAAAVVQRAEASIAGATDPGAVLRRLRELAPTVRGPADQWLGALSQRELEVLAMLSGPLSAAEIAAELYVSPNTVRTHVKAIHRKLGVTTRQEAVRRAGELGLDGPKR